MEEVREGVSQTLHDDIAQQLFALKLSFQNITSKDMDSKRYSEFLDKFDNIYDTIRSLSHNLKPIQLHDLDLITSLQDLIIYYNNTTQIEGTFITYQEELELSHRVRACVFRVRQEAITNIIKHSHATEYIINLSKNVATLRLVVSDNGKGVTRTSMNQPDYFKSGIGLFNMRERVEYLNGSIEIETKPNEGFTIFITLPVV